MKHKGIDYKTSTQERMVEFLENYKNYFEYAYGTTKKQNIQENHQPKNIN